MGGSQSVEVPGGGTEGYHVLRVQEGSPGQQAGLEAFFDFIVAIGNTRLNQDNDTLKNLLKANIEKEISMTVYSSKSGTVRQLFITPSTLWGGQGLLGVSIRFCSFEGANENVWHILDVSPSSPAELAGLRQYSDYIIGADSVLHESEDLFSLIEAHEGRPLKLYVYNTETDHCREVTITPNGAWGGEGSLGCGIGYGYLHRIPTDEDFPPAAPAEEAASVLATPLVSATPTVMTPTSTTNPPDQPLKPDVPIFGTEASSVPTTAPSLEDTPHQMIPSSPPEPVLDPTVMAGMPQPDPATLAASFATMMTPPVANMASPVMTPTTVPMMTPATVPMMTPATVPMMTPTTVPMMTPTTVPMMTPATIAMMTPVLPMMTPETAAGGLISPGPAVPLMAHSTPIAGVTGLDPAVLAGMPTPDPAVLATMNFSLPPAASQSQAAS